mmetsp:Transcript_8633/g.23973  ORF Transcript_8633/g.23973 Transcript_8633/m.23973 type:complete len:243 (-) Transcript_8633:126-854(-)
MTEYTPTAAAAPSSGPTQKIHMSLKTLVVPALMTWTRAGPKVRVGLMEQPSTGMSTEWARKTERPMARGARLLLALLSSFTAVSRTTNINRKVPINSPMRAPICVQPSPTLLVPRPPVRSLGAGYITLSTAAPRTEPSICAKKLQTPCQNDTSPWSTRPKVTAQLIWPPLMCPMLYASTVIASPKVSETCNTHAEPSSLAMLMALPQPKKTKRNMATNSAKALWTETASEAFPSSESSLPLS